MQIRYPGCWTRPGPFTAEDRAANRTMGELGAALIQGPTDVITHCNAGALATGGYGTALGVIRSAFAAGRIGRVYADETRPWMQGSRLTAWELAHSGIPVSVQTDAAAASLMAAGGIGWVIVGSDRIAANGDVANKIGTYALAVLARHHGVKFMVVAPTSTIDLRVQERHRDPHRGAGGERGAVLRRKARGSRWGRRPQSRFRRDAGRSRRRDRYRARCGRESNGGKDASLDGARL